MQQPASASAPLPADGFAELARSAQAAAALIELAIDETQRPVATLGQALTRIGAAAAAGRQPDTADVTACIESLQFHDRMIQELTHVRDLLAHAATSGPAQEQSRDWPALREALRARFTSESHRLLFNLLMPDETTDEHIELHADEGSVELF